MNLPEWKHTLERLLENISNPFAVAFNRRPSPGRPFL